MGISGGVVVTYVRLPTRLPRKPLSCLQHSHGGPGGLRRRLFRIFKSLLSSEMCGIPQRCCTIHHTTRVATPTLYFCEHGMINQRCYASITPYEMCVRLG